MIDDRSRQAREGHGSPPDDLPESQAADSLDVIDTASEQSFPASDAPSWAGGQSHPASSAEAAPPSERRDPSAQNP